MEDLRYKLPRPPDLELQEPNKCVQKPEGLQTRFAEAFFEQGLTFKNQPVMQTAGRAQEGRSQ